LSPGDGVDLAMSGLSSSGAPSIRQIMLEVLREVTQEELTSGVAGTTELTNTLLKSIRDHAFKDNPYAKDINRLITSLNPTGTVVFQDDFEANLVKWSVQAFQSGAGGGGVRDTTKAYAGGASLKISTGTVASAGYEAIKHIPTHPSLRDLKKVGLEFRFAIPSTPQTFAFGVEKWDGSRLYRGDVNLWQDLNALQIRQAGTYTTILTDVRTLNYDKDAWCAQAFNYAKLVNDLDAKKFGTLILNDRLIDLSSYALEDSGVDTGPPCIGVYFIWLNRSTTTSADLFIDDVVVTCLEP